MFHSKNKIIIFSVLFSFFLLQACDSGKKKTEDLNKALDQMATLNNTRKQLGVSSALLPDEVRKKLKKGNYSDVKKAEKIGKKEAKKNGVETMKGVTALVTKGDVTKAEEVTDDTLAETTTASQQRAAVMAGASLMNTFGEDSTTVLSGLGSLGLTGFGLAGLACKESQTLFNNALDQALGSSFKSSEIKSVEDLLAMRDKVLEETLNLLFEKLDQEEDGFRVKEIEKYLVSRVALSVCESSSSFQDEVTAAAELLITSYSENGDFLTREEFLDVGRVLQRLHDKILVDAFYN